MYWQDMYQIRLTVVKVVAELSTKVITTARAAEERLCRQYKTPLQQSSWTKQQRLRAFLEKEINVAWSCLRQLQGQGEAVIRELGPSSTVLADLYLSCSFVGEEEAYIRAKDLALNYLRSYRQLQTAVELAKRHEAWDQLAIVCPIP